MMRIDSTLRLRAGGMAVPDAEAEGGCGRGDRVPDGHQVGAAATGELLLEAGGRSEGDDPLYYRESFMADQWTVNLDDPERGSPGAGPPR